MPSVTPFSLELEKELIEDNAKSTGFNIAEPISTGVQIGEKYLEIEKAREFEKILQTGKQGLNELLNKAKQEGYDVSGLGNINLIETREDADNWAEHFSKKIQYQDKLRSAEKMQELAASGDVSGAYREGAKSGNIAGKEAVEFQAQQNKTESLQGLLDKINTPVSGGQESQPIPSEPISTEKPISGQKMSDEAVLNQVPEGLRPTFMSVAEKLEIPVNILVGIAKRENASFKEDQGYVKKGPQDKGSSAMGLMQITDSTGQRLFKEAQNSGLISDSLTYKEAVKMAEPNLIMGGLYLKENITKHDGDLDKGLLSHYLGPEGVNKYLNLKDGERYIQDGRDITDDIPDWLAKVKQNTGLEGSGGTIKFKPKKGSIEYYNEQIDSYDKEIQRQRDAIKTLTSHANQLSNEEAKTYIDQANNTINSLNNDKKFALDERNKAEKLKEKQATASKSKSNVLKSEKDIAETLKNLLEVEKGTSLVGTKTWFGKATSGLQGGIKEGIANYTSYDDRNKHLLQSIGLFSGALSTTIGKESGRLTDNDRRFAMRMMFSLSDSEELRSAKRAYLNVLVNRLGADESDPNYVDYESYKKAEKKYSEVLDKLTGTINKEEKSKKKESKPEPRPGSQLNKKPKPQQKKQGGQRNTVEDF